MELTARGVDGSSSLNMPSFLLHSHPAPLHPLIPPPTHTQDDLICLPAKLASSLGSLGPLVLVSRVTSSLTLLDPLTLRSATMDAAVYWRTPFKALLTSRALVEYVVLDIEPIHGGGGGGGGYGSSSSSSGKWCLAEVQVARKSDFGRNDTVFFARTHLGHILHPGGLGLCVLEVGWGAGIRGFGCRLWCMGDQCV